MYEVGKEITREVIENILENANFAPNHKLTEPWRFKVLRGAAKQRLSDFLIEDYMHNTPLNEQSERKVKKMSENPILSDCVIAICMQRHEGVIDEWEEIAAVAMAVQNMWLTCASLGIGCYWSTPPAMKRMGDFLQLTEGELCLGLFYMGYTSEDIEKLPYKRTPVADKTQWIE
jgi:nitroreductase